MAKTCFVICPIDKEGSEIRKRSDTLLKAFIEKACTSLDYKAVRIDHVNHNDKIDTAVLNHLSDSELVIADLTDCNPNVFYELGYRSALNKPVIQLALDGTKIPFDISTVRTIFYTVSDVSKTDKIIKELTDTIKSIDSQNEAITSLEPSHDNQTNVLKNLTGMLMGIQNSINNLYPLIEKRDSSFIKSMIEATTNELRKSSSSPRDAAIKELTNKVMEDPSKLENLLKIMQRYPNFPTQDL